GLNRCVAGACRICGQTLLLPSLPLVAAGKAPSSLVAGDLNGDGRGDLAVVSSGNNNVSVLLNQGGGVFGAAVNYTVGTNPIAVAAGDLNGDGRLDLVVANG